ncbi:putative flippase GtrA [Rhizobium sp. BK251]|nr:putative flippase GtrA [Rhizobium sp. BK251]
MTGIVGQFVRYIAVGVVNTAVGLLIIFAAMRLGFGDITANLVGYLVGFLISYSVNSLWTFRAPLGRSKALRYAAVMALSYLINLAAMLFARDLLDTGSHLAQVAGILAYSFAGFIGSRFFVFRISRASA